MNYNFVCLNFEALTYQVFVILSWNSTLLYILFHEVQQIMSKSDATFLNSQTNPYGVTSHWNCLGKAFTMRYTQ